MAEVIRDWSWGERPYDQLQNLIGDYFKSKGFSVLRLSWGLEKPGAPQMVPHFLVARDGVTALVAAKPIGHARRRDEGPLLRFCEEWAGHIFICHARDDCDHAVAMLERMARLQAADTPATTTPSA